MHISFCFLFLVMPVLVSTRPPGEPFLTVTPPFIRDIIGNALLLVFFYVNYYLLIPRFYFKHKYVLYAALVLACFILVFGLPSLFTGRFTATKAPGPPPPFLPATGGPGQSSLPWLSFVFDELKHHLYLFIIALFFSLLLRVRGRLADVKEEKLKAELSSLKAQINPHFLFNALNSIYALVVKKDDKAPDAIIHLSGLMRYVIKDANDYKISLQKELDYISNYIELQKSRLGDTARINYACNGSPDGNEIAPLILITYIENAFKYGVNPDERSELDIKTGIDGNCLRLFVSNRKVKLSDKAISTGIGMENTKGRLRLLYPQKHVLNIEESNDHYTVTLTMYL
ncbi:MAG TPA: histidine kinase [Chitinophagaceae bacterium]|nr:histidine kinase [Chitinophagaceae bacterium]